MSGMVEQVSCIILAGGEGRRVHGKDKGLVVFNDQPLIALAIAAVSDQCDDIVISANRNIDAYKQYADTVISDTSDSYRGPLAGIAACLPYCIHERILVIACDMPALPAILVERLSADADRYPICIATVAGHHQLAMIIHHGLLPSIRQYLDNAQLKLITWVRSLPYQTVSFDDMPEAFANLNQI
jgi:molybdopterin-guanine dinucleotide biosynthesis protein A